MHVALRCSWGVSTGFQGIVGRPSTEGPTPWSDVCASRGVVGSSWSRGCLGWLCVLEGKSLLSSVVVQTKLVDACDGAFIDGGKLAELLARRKKPVVCRHGSNCVGKESGQIVGGNLMPRGLAWSSQACQLPFPNPRTAWLEQLEREIGVVRP
jgi:hypothetical protein